MKKTTLLLAVLIARTTLSAQTPAPAPVTPAYSVTADFGYTSKYVFRGIELAKGAFQPWVKFSSNDFYASIWSSAPVDRGFELEFDYTAGYTGFKLSKDWGLDVGLTAYTYPGLGGGADKTTLEPLLGVNGTMGDFTSCTYAYYDLTLKAFTLQEAVGYGVKLDDKASVNLLATVGRVAPEAGGSYTYYGFGVTIPCKLTQTATLTVGLQYSDHNIAGLKGSHLWGSIDLVCAF